MKNQFLIENLIDLNLSGNFIDFDQNEAELNRVNIRLDGC